MTAGVTVDLHDRAGGAVELRGDAGPVTIDATLQRRGSTRARITGMVCGLGDDEALDVVVEGRTIGRSLGRMRGTLAGDTIDVSLRRHLGDGIDVDGTVGPAAVRLRLGPGSAGRRRVVHRQPAPPLAMALRTRHRGVELRGTATRPVDALVVSLALPLIWFGRSRAVPGGPPSTR